MVQWQMRSYKTLDDLFEQVEFFVDAVSDYKSDFVLFPEYFNAPLMSKYNDKGESQAIRGLAKYTDEIRERFMNLAISYNINIITGSMPYVKEDGLLYNVGFLCRRDGTYEMYEKLHVTPDEIKGKSGKVTIRFDYTNNEKRTVKIDGKDTQMYVPFLMVTGTVLDNEKFSNVKVTNGKLENDGDR